MDHREKTKKEKKWNERRGNDLAEHRPQLIEDWCWHRDDGGKRRTEAGGGGGGGGGDNKAQLAKWGVLLIKVRCRRSGKMTGLDRHAVLIVCLRGGPWQKPPFLILQGLEWHAEIARTSKLITIHFPIRVPPKTRREWGRKEKKKHGRGDILLPCLSIK